MTDKEAMKLAFEALVSINSEFVCNSAHHGKKDRHEFNEECPVNMRYRTAIAVLEERLKNPKKWVGLTDVEAAECWSTGAVKTWKAFESKLKAKNT
jgi:hypothetical protein